MKLEGSNGCELMVLSQSGRYKRLEVHRQRMCMNLEFKSNFRASTFIHFDLSLIWIIWFATFTIYFHKYPSTLIESLQPMSS